MARKAGPFDLSVFYEVENRRLQRAFNPQTGFVKSGQGVVTAGTGAQLVIAAYADGALIDGMYVENPTSETVTLTTNTASTNPRIDRLVMRLDMTAKTIAPFQIVGTPAASPSAPTLTQTATTFDMPLCRYTFPGSASAQNPGSIVDERLWLEASTDRTLGDAHLADRLLLPDAYPAFTDIATVTATSRGRLCTARFTGVAFNGASGTDRTLDWRVTCDGVFVGGFVGVNIPVANLRPVTRVGAFSSTPAAGSHTWKLQATPSAANSVYVDTALLTVVER